MKKIHQAVNLSDAFSKNLDMSSRENEILKEITILTGFSPKKNIWRSEYWGKNLGASHWLGVYDEKNAVLKIQGVKPEISEIFMVGEFAKQNKSKLIRPPMSYKVLPWSDTRGYEAIISEYAAGDNVVVDGKIIIKENIATFMSYYGEYRKNCLPTIPWLPKPEIVVDWRVALDKLYSISQKAYPGALFRKKEDYKLAQKAYQLLSKIYKKVSLEFMHGHFSCKDLIYEKSGSNRIILFSNLFWKWKFPFFDAIFAYHWFMYELARVNGISPVQVEEQRELWLQEIFKATGASKLQETSKLLKAALLERAVAGFLLDAFLMDPKKSISEYLVDSTRKQAERLIAELS